MIYLLGYWVSLALFEIMLQLYFKQFEGLYKSNFLNRENITFVSLEVHVKFIDVSLCFIAEEDFEVEHYLKFLYLLIDWSWLKTYLQVLVFIKDVFIFK